MLKINDIKIYKSKKILSYSEAIEKIAKLKHQKKTVGLCHGGFDLLHPGHVKHFESAKKLCDTLFVSITSDRFITSRKGEDRPIYPENIRAYIISNIKFVDYVVISDFNTGIEIIEILKPDYYIKGPDYIDCTTDEMNAERKVITSIGGKIKYTNDPKLSSTKIIEYIKDKINS